MLVILNNFWGTHLLNLNNVVFKLHVLLGICSTEQGLRSLPLTCALFVQMMGMEGREDIRNKQKTTYIASVSRTVMNVACMSWYGI